MKTKLLLLSLFVLPVSYLSAQVSTQPDSTCAGNTGETYLVSPAAGSSYNWSVTGSGNTLHSTNTNQITIDWTTVVGVDTVKVVETDVNGCQGDLVRIAVVRIAPPTAVAGDDATICSNGSFTVSGASATNYLSVGWTTSGDGSFTNANTLTPEYTPGASDIAAGFVDLTLTANPNTPCALAATDVMRVNIIAAPIASAGVNDTLCWDETIYLDDPSASNYTALLWTTSGTGTFDDATLLNPTYNLSDDDNANGGVTLTLTVTGNAPCTTAQSTKLLVIRPKPVTGPILHF
ncbi:MAG: hypothetical protein PHQ65_05550 [Bacteroidales bacterium]|nr:hypothetical protein [Bacteroidales bacterium]MDD3664707.1 hypothetical protein [Bacteroidales bacterium]